MDKNQLQAIVDHSTNGLVVVDDDDRILFANPAAHALLNVEPGSLVGGELSSPDIGNRGAGGNRHIVGQCSLAVTRVPIEWQSESAYLVCMYDRAGHDDIGGDNNADDHHNEVLLNLGRLILADKPLSELRHTVALNMRDVLDVELAAVFNYDTHDRTATLVAGAGWPGGYVGELTLPADHNSQVGTALLDNETIVVANWPTDSRFADGRIGEQDVVSSITTPLPHADGRDNTPWGALCAYTTHVRTFSEWDINFLQRSAFVLAYATQRDYLMSRQGDNNMLLKAAGRVAHIGGWETDIETGRIIWSDEVAAIHDLPARAITFNHSESYKYVAEESADTALEGMNKLLQEGIPLDREVRVTTAKGRAIWTRVIGEPIFDDTGRVLRARGAIQDITDQKKAREWIDFLALRDPLTELPNRRLLTDELHKAIDTCRRTGRKAALMLLDLDDFKTLNDTLGHAHGDDLLQQVAGRLVERQREGDVVARFGGDEFVLIVGGLHENGHKAAAEAELLGREVLDTLNKPYQLGQAEYHSRQSLGITLLGFDNDDATELLKQADLTMYEAKARGRDQICVYDPELQETIKARAALERDIRRGLQDDEFRPYFQPQVDCSGQVIGAEVLARWHHSRRGLISPAEFIPLAEETGLILDLGEVILTQACEQLARWQSHPFASTLHLAVNVSAQQFHHPEFVKSVKRTLEVTGACANQLILELTETSILDNVDDTIEKMTALGHHGVTFSLDDFGTGYSSLYYLKRLPLTQLKIDKSFVRNADRDADNGTIVRTIAALAGAMQMDFIAEGVETRAERKFLADLDCRLYQGFLFGRPQPIEQFQAQIEVKRKRIF